MKVVVEAVMEVVNLEAEVLICVCVFNSVCLCVCV